MAIIIKRIKIINLKDLERKTITIITKIITIMEMKDMAIILIKIIRRININHVRIKNNFKSY